MNFLSPVSIFERASRTVASPTPRRSWPIANLTTYLASSGLPSPISDASILILRSLLPAPEVVAIFISISKTSFTSSFLPDILPCLFDPAICSAVSPRSPVFLNRASIFTLSFPVASEIDSSTSFSAMPISIPENGGASMPCVR